MDQIISCRLEAIAIHPFKSVPSTDPIRTHSTMGHRTQDRRMLSREPPLRSGQASCARLGGSQGAVGWERSMVIRNK